jgi:hypothetical protein
MTDDRLDFGKPDWFIRWSSQRRFEFGATSSKRLVSRKSKWRHSAAVFAFAAALAFGLVARTYPVVDHYRKHVD